MSTVQTVIFAFLSAASLRAQGAVKNDLFFDDWRLNVFWLCVFAAAICLYSLPVKLVEKRKVLNSDPIIALNLLFGWTGIGWVAALIWACVAKSKNMDSIATLASHETESAKPASV